MGRTARAVRLVTLVLALTAIAAMGAGCISLPSSNRAGIPQGVPPGVGAPVPYIDIHAPGRTADTLANWARPISNATGIGVYALEAYGNAAEIQRQQHPECGIGWTTLAGIAGTESKHGRHDGASVAPNGDTSPPIRGPELNGKNGNMRMVDQEHPTRADGSPNYVRAEGPFQFLPETWQRFGVDANGDGRADPDNMDDAALSAARYLCVASGGDMTTAKGWLKALMVYNQSRPYAQRVADRANAYSVNRRY
ncbi:lytic murein transglycosylase [Gordonia sp. X0973]|uniref:lytic transglycosylase domain-containing protein n=1 Tax=Gordonia sp. X0973 TaxID=2742602 RepID=UPI000F53A461|nr:lytic murein transglycosylase [Gordonia sp. X0973]QKT06538.1 lytic murein transglycosylase [Gordonia sp. X0973]